MSAPKRRHMNGKYKDILAEQLAAAEARDALGSAASLPIGDGSPTPSILDIDSDSDSEDDSSTNSDDVRFEMEDAPDDQPATSAMTQSFGRVQSHPSNITVPDKSYFDMRGDKEKRAYIESFCDILGRIKTNHHFRCKGCGETFVGQYLNMLVHMSGTNNHLSVRTRYCKNPIPAIRDKILQDYADYNAKQQLYNSHVKAEPGTKPMCSPQPMASMIPYQQQTGRKRGYGEFQYPRHAPPQYRSALANIPTGAAIFENSICNRAGLGQSSDTTTHEEVSNYYSKVLGKSSDLQTNCCTTAGAPPQYLQRALSNVHNDVLAKYYGCGFIAPELLRGLRVLDMGCGAGRDCYVLAQLVGEQGRVVGVDMCAEQLATARGTVDWHRERFGYQQANTAFLTGYLERLFPAGADGAKKVPRAAEEGQGGSMEGVTQGEPLTAEAGAEGNEVELVEDSFDVIVSNCVINLSPDKAAVLNNAYRLLKPGGELYFSDVYCTQRVPAQLRQDPVLWGECLSGALYWNDFLRLARDCGFGDPRLVSSSPVTVGNPQLEAAIAQHMPPTAGSNGKAAPQFYSATYRLWKIAELEPDCEDYGQAAVYLGTIPYPEVQRVLPSPLPLAVVENAYVPMAATSTSNTDGQREGNGHAHSGAAQAPAAPVRLMSAYALDDHHLFPAGKVVPVCGNTFRMLRDTRLRPHFQFVGGEFSQHFGIFQGCGKSVPFQQSGDSSGGGKCC